MKYTEITKEFTNKFFEIVEKSNNVVITAHASPDGDSISSVLSIYRIISDKYNDKKVRIVYSGDFNEHFSYFENFNKIEWVPEVADAIEDCDLIIMLDCSNYYRFSKNEDKFRKIKNQISIDHHASEPETVTLSTIVPEMPSCAELIFCLFEDFITLDKNLSEIFLLGIISDTGSFTFLDSSKSETFRVAKKLLDVGGINISILKSKYNSISKREFDIVQEYIKNTSFKTVDGWPPFQYTYVTRDFTEKGEYSNNELGAASKIYIGSYLPYIKDYTWGFIIRPKSNSCGVSFRSLFGLNVRRISERMSIGSGHDRASGGLFENETNPESCIELIVQWLNNNKPEID